MMIKFTAFFLLCLLVCPILAQTEEENLSAAEWKQRGDEALKLKMLDKATEHYSKAIELEPANYLYYYSRALVFTSRGRYNLAIADYTTTIELNPTHVTSFVKRGQLNMENGNFEEAFNDFTQAKNLKSTTVAATEGLQQVEKARKLVEQLSGLLASENRNNELIISIVTELTDIATHCEKYLILRAETYLAVAKYAEASSDAVRVLRFNPKSMSAHWIVGTSSFLQGDFEYALTSYKKALSFDPESSKFIKQIRLTKSIKKAVDSFYETFQAENWAGALESYTSAVALSDQLANNIVMTEKYCKCLLETKKYQEALAACTKAIDENPQLFEAHLWRGETYIMLDDFQAARRDLQKAQEVNRNDGRIHNAYQRLERKEKLAARKDYYKLLGVPKDATESQIKKAYRKLALEFHPDKHAGADKIEAEKKFQEITEAYEVLGDPETRGKYDRGEDLQPNRGGGGGNPFQGFQQGFPGGFRFQWG